MLALPAAKSGPCALVYFRKSRAQSLGSLNIVLPKRENNLDSVEHHQQTSSHLGSGEVLYSVWHSASGGDSRARTDPEHNPGLCWEHSSRYMQESAEQAGFYQSNTIETKKKKKSVEKANGNYVLLELPFSKNLLWSKMWRKYGFYLCKQFLAKCLLFPPSSLLRYKYPSLLAYKQGCCHRSLLDSIKKRFKRITRWLNGLMLGVRQEKAGSLLAGAGGEPWLSHYSLPILVSAFAQKVKLNRKLLCCMTQRSTLWSIRKIMFIKCYFSTLTVKTFGLVFLT